MERRVGDACAPFNAGLYAYAVTTFPDNPRLAAIPGFDPEAAAWQVALEFLTGYVVEYSLSVDNIFVFVRRPRLLRACPRATSTACCSTGSSAPWSSGASSSRLGAVLIRFHWVVWLFGAFLIITGVRMLLGSERRGARATIR